MASLQDRTVGLNAVFLSPTELQCILADIRMFLDRQLKQHPTKTRRLGLLRWLSNRGGRRASGEMGSWGDTMEERAANLSASLEMPAQGMKEYAFAKKRCVWKEFDAPSVFGGCYNFFPSMDSFRDSNRKGWHPTNPMDARWLMPTQHCQNFRKHQRVKRCAVPAYHVLLDDKHDQARASQCSPR